MWLTLLSEPKSVGLYKSLTVTNLQGNLGGLHIYSNASRGCFWKMHMRLKLMEDGPPTLKDRVSLWMSNSDKIAKFYTHPIPTPHISLSCSFHLRASKNWSKKSFSNLDLILRCICLHCSADCSNVETLCSNIMSIRYTTDINVYTERKRRG